ncbi:ATP-grasp domain-containing protein [uncultured Eudoraea sp.]|uniref:ATP-grasp domain-containing protein n=1 Tax=uncultured Eudoraea sp. TaxID=1035614 RepID=UPI00261004D3|nr:ATP-grasp domain-containing protein [uncultured Eudoraea sp.]
MKKDEHQFSVLIPDGESKYLMLVLNCLSLVKGIKVHVMSNDEKYAALRYSNRICSYSYYPITTDDSLWISNINKEITKYKIDVLMPIFNDGIMKLNLNKNSLSNECALVALPPLTSLNKALNKWSLAEHMKNNLINGPNSILIKPEEFNNIDKFNFQFPCLIKPTVNTGGGIGIQKINSKEELKQYINNKNPVHSILLQEYIDGFDLGCNVLCSQGRILATTIQKGNLYNNIPYSPQIGLQFIKEDKALELAKKLMKSLNWSGVANIDMIYDQERDLVQILEINPRYWLTTDASAIAGVNFPYLYCLNALGINFEVPAYSELNYLNLQGLVKSVSKDPRLLFNFKFIWNNTPFKFAIKDPIPMIYHFIWRTKNILLQKLRKPRV